MKTIEIYRDHDKQHLDEILRNHGYKGLIPTDTILDKTIPGIGATHGEIIDTTRHSIIIEPHKPVIEVKTEVFKEKLCPVIEGVSEKDILKYLESDIQPKKIITTPESFHKVLKALNIFDVNYRKNFFLLIDECEKLVQDSLFRKKMIKPLEEFFLFDNKAVVSATPLEFSAKEFHSFQPIKVIPAYEYKKDLLLLITNNIKSACRNVITIKEKDNRPFLIFTNCKRTILHLVKQEGIKDDYKVHCAEDLNIRFFKDQQVENVSYTVREQKYAKFNFFTSRFFSAVDMFLDVEPHVLIVTNVPETRHSLIEPSVDSVQIYGRARNGVASITHITNLFPSSEKETKEEVINKVLEEIYFVKGLNDFKEKAPNELTNQIIDSIKDKLYANQIFDADNNLVDYHKDNFIFKRLLKFSYTKEELLYKAYKEVPFFITKKHILREAFSDKDKTIFKKPNSKPKRRYIAYKIEDILISYHYNQDHWTDERFIVSIDKLRKLDELTFDIYRLFGLEYLEKVDFNRRAMVDTLFEYKRENGRNDFLIIDRIIAAFPLQIIHYCHEAKIKLQEIYDYFEVETVPGKKKQAKASDLELYFECSRKNSKKKLTDGKCPSYYLLHRPKDKIAEELKFLATDYFY